MRQGAARVRERSERRVRKRGACIVAVVGLLTERTGEIEDRRFATIDGLEHSKDVPIGDE